VTVLAELDGHAFDLAALARHFPTGDPHIAASGDGTYLATALDDLCGDAPGLLEAAREQLDRLNGYARLMDGSYQRVRLNGRFFRDSDRTHGQVVVGDQVQLRESFTIVQPLTIETRAAAFGVATVTGGAPSTPPPPAGPEHLARTASNKDLDDILDLVGKAERLSWSELYKVFEIIRDAVSRRGREGLVATGWTTKSTLNAFTGSADHHLVSGIHEGRHARMSGGPPRQTMTLDEAQKFIRDLAFRWLDSLD
jgi:hypothetical protein